MEGVEKKGKGISPKKLKSLFCFGLASSLVTFENYS